MYEITARDFPIWGAEPQQNQREARGYRSRLYGRKEPEMKAERIREEKETPAEPKGFRRKVKQDEFKRRYGLSFIAILALAFYSIVICCVTGTIVHFNTKKQVEDEQEAAYEKKLEDYKAQQKEEKAREYFLTGEASREAFINQGITTGARLISQEQNDEVKGTKLGVAIARIEHPDYPNTIQEVAAEPGQFMFYSEDNTYTQHDWDLAESMLRPYYEDGKLPDGLTTDIVFLEWNGATATGRNSYIVTGSTKTWRYQG